MQDALIYFILSFLISASVIALLLPLSRRYGWLDPICDRKDHEVPTPPIGGFGVFLGITVPGFYFMGFNAETLGFFTGGLLLVITGALDDRYHIDWKIRIAVQIIAALLLIYIAGAHAEHVGPLFGFGDIELGWLSVPFTVFVTLGLINAINMLDGVDGLLGAVTGFVVIMFICASLYSGAYDIALRLFWVLGAIVGFLWFNLRRIGQARAQVFMGDAGSGFVGFTLAFVIFRLTQNPGHPISPVLGPFLLAPPIIDCLVLIMHRLRRGQSPFSAGRDHAHHLMLDAGYSVNQVVFCMIAITCLSGLFGALAMYINIPESLMVMSYLLAIFSWFWITENHERAMNYLGWFHKKIYG